MNKLDGLLYEKYLQTKIIGMVAKRGFDKAGNSVLSTEYFAGQEMFQLALRANNQRRAIAEVMAASGSSWTLIEDQSNKS